ncbi:MAG: hypothetical protein J0L61_10085 [Planctomycetes bacterium]|nr:hypothetical protein [Planctomycetota bacterium]
MHYDSHNTERLAARLDTVSTILMVLCLLPGLALGLGVGAFIGAAALRTTGGIIGAVIGLVIGGALGYALGTLATLMLRVTEQLMVTLGQVESNTRHIGASPSPGPREIAR